MLLKTLHEVLLEFSKSMAPVLPFICEKIYQGLIEENNESIHYCDYPEADENLIDKDLEDNIELAKKVIKSVRNLRVKLKLPNKQPLNSVKIITKDKEIDIKIKKYFFYIHFILYQVAYDIKFFFNFFIFSNYFYRIQRLFVWKF